MHEDRNRSSTQDALLEESAEQEASFSSPAILRSSYISPEMTRHITCVAIRPGETESPPRRCQQRTECDAASQQLWITGILAHAIRRRTMFFTECQKGKHDPLRPRFLSLCTGAATHEIWFLRVYNMARCRGLDEPGRLPVSGRGEKRLRFSLSSVLAVSRSISVAVP